MSYKFVKDLTTINRDVRSNRTIKYIVIHYTGNQTDKASSNTNYFRSTYRGASAHYFVDETSVYQCVEDKDIAWAVGRNFGSNNLFGTVTNSNSISIEMCSTNSKIAEDTFNNTVELTKKLMNTYGISTDHVYTHQMICSKKCPGWTGWLIGDDSEWLRFKKALSVTTTTTTTTKSSPNTLPLGIGSAVKFSSYYNNENDDISKAKFTSGMTGIIYEVKQGAANPYHIFGHDVWINAGDVTYDVTNDIANQQYAHKIGSVVTVRTHYSDCNGKNPVSLNPPIQMTIDGARLGQKHPYHSKGFGTYFSDDDVLKYNVGDKVLVSSHYVNATDGFDKAVAIPQPYITMTIDKIVNARNPYHSKGFNTYFNDGDIRQKV